MLSTKDIKTGLKIELEGEPFEILEFLHVKPGKGGAFVRTKLRNILTGAVKDHTFRSGEKFAKPDLEKKSMQFLYRDGTDCVFMDMSSYEQVNVPEDSLAQQVGFLQDGQEVDVLTYQGQIIDIELPSSVILEVTETEPGLKGDTVSGATKPATLETGLTVQVPLFIEQGEKVRVDTRSSEYIGRT
ncbi:elongation factor P [Desulfohalobium retbaense]|uniref:Elongation factor P n=1 Tax=Desulfohalobium retbaense (strain ATCC 49708 / DSM 5692 / JCM 16813 / HR100) TaxID=485915 RepID=C8X2E2_DESRD|nr:elongation factor P [Desulfohalobium retbaense]ACV68589.1 translation elongation factor P [Desulfohalobium retbaense DSM 5692]